MTDKPDPTKDPEFQKVVRRFLKTPPKPHKPAKDKEGKTKGGTRRQLSKSKPTV